MTETIPQDHAANQHPNDPNNGYEEMDLTPYEDDDDSTLHQKL